MNFQEVTPTTEYLARLDTGADWRAEIESFAADEGIEAAWFSGLGAVQDADIMYYDQSDQEYYTTHFDEPLEVAACLGNITPLDDGVFAHTHAVLSREDGTTLAGHLDAATVFAGELHVRAFEADEAFERTHDERTDLDLWF